MAYENLANVPKDYKLGEKEAKFHGLITDPSLVLKLYSMYDKDIPLKEALVEQSKGFLEDRIKNGEIVPYLGFGFAILSKDVLNVARWGTTYPIVIQNQIYSFDGNDLNKAELLDIREVGAYCLWESEIKGHEIKAWRTYLNSEKTETDKQRYINNVIEGIL